MRWSVPGVLLLSTLVLAAPARAQEAKTVDVQVSPVPLGAGEEGRITVTVDRPAPPDTSVYASGPALFNQLKGFPKVPEGATSVTFPFRMPTTFRPKSGAFSVRVSVPGDLGRARTVSVPIAQPDPAQQRVVSVGLPEIALTGTERDVRIEIARPAPAGGYVLEWANNSAYGSPGVVAPGLYVEIPEGEKVVTVPVGFGTDASEPVEVTGQFGWESSLYRYATYVVPKTFALARGYLRPGESGEMVIGIGSAPNPDGTTVRLRSEDPSVIVPETVVVPAGEVGVKIPVRATSALRGDVTVTASWNGQTAENRVYLNRTSPPPPSGWVELGFVHSGQAVSASGTGIVQTPQTHAPGAQWKFVGVGGGAYTIVNRLSGQCLEASSTAPGPLRQAPCEESRTQLWTFDTVPPGSPYYVIANIASELVINQSGATTDAGGPVIQWPRSPGATNEQLVLTPAQDAPPPPSGWLELGFVHSGLAMGVSGASIVQTPQRGQPAAQWKLVPTGDRGFAILNQASEQCLDTESDAVGPLRQRPCDGGLTQRWDFDTGSPDAPYRIVRNLASGLVINQSGATQDPGGAVLQWWPSPGATNERITLTPVPDAGERAARRTRRAT
jgi:hypothetical protein